MKKEKSGVYKARKADKTLYFRVFIYYKDKSINLGSFDDEKIAKEAFNEASRITTADDITLRDYNESCYLKFDKWVCLINYRDNDMYFSNPIYLRPGLFYYYLNPEEILKFDIDDLFFYSSHKIMRRGSHMFVANFGSQLNIASKYGIKTNAVIGRDYRFLNNDPLDYRYSNIELINTYHGVEPIINENKTIYKAFIHINGNFIIGIYDTIEEAAIAYNKAADILKRNGINKNYPQNVIKTLPHKEYASIYLKIDISDKIVTYKGGI